MRTFPTTRQWCCRLFGVYRADIDREVLGVGEDQTPVVKGDRPPMDRCPIVAASSGVGQFGVVLDDHACRCLRLPTHQHPVPTRIASGDAEFFSLSSLMDCTFLRLPLGA